ncbi:hypothetical protein [Frigoribacterium sp. VKM Ac-2836]|uniref:hypothetical protein n=1 Tax=Frigoribacterium sp. VKM Ac-2836 TaxID=2739014 RepID=UPI001564DEC1|nr:hypothetical protein [Frigoribacterium sp. VKM Ac-2836]NRD25052.1 hypothetical protein [Frigoribacterium sp. VKM Ac-2836]
MTERPLPPLVRVSSIGNQSREAAGLRRRAARGEVRAIATGTYVESSAWSELTPRRRHVLRARAVVDRLDPGVVVSHRSAAAVHDVPVIGDWPERVHVIDPRRRSAQTTTGVVRHAAPLAPHEVRVAHDLRVTSAARTALDLALTSSFRDAVVAVDGVLHRGSATRGELLAGLDARSTARGCVGARRALDFAEAGSESAGESWCRVLLRQLGAPGPVLQKAFPWARGRDIVDFWWPEFGVVLEFDGVSKYTKARWLRGRSPQQVVVDEKVREDRIRDRPEVRGFGRTVWAELERPELLRAELIRVGLPLRTMR